jgi:hypothetical protein
MAANKAKRSIHPTQPQPELPELTPVRSHVYGTIAEMNAGLEQAVQNLETLVRIKYFSSDSTRGILNQLSRLRAQVNRELIAVITERETINAKHFQQLCQQPQKEASQKEAPRRNTA